MSKPVSLLCLWQAVKYSHSFETLAAVIRLFGDDREKYILLQRNNQTMKSIYLQNDQTCLSVFSFSSAIKVLHTHTHTHDYLRTWKTFHFIKSNQFKSSLFILNKVKRVFYDLKKEFVSINEAIRESSDSRLPNMLNIFSWQHLEN